MTVLIHTEHPRRGWCPESLRRLFPVTGPAVALRLTRRAFVLGLAAFAVGCASSAVGRKLSLNMESPAFQKRTEQVEKLVLSVDGAAGQGFTGMLTVDGVSREVSGVTPAEYPLEASVLIGDFRKQGGRGSLSFRIQAMGSDYAVGTLKRRDARCRFGYHAGEVELLVTR